MPDQLKSIDARTLLVRSLMLLAVALALAHSWFAVRWYLGNTIAEYMNSDDGRLETASMAVRLAPDDPLAHWRLGDLAQKRLLVDQLGEATKEYEKAVSLSPNDYRLWLTFGRALEESGELERAEKAMRRAAELAPSYSYPRWYLGNLILRSGREAQAFEEMRRASEADPQLRPQVFDLAWQVYGQDFAALTTAVGTSAAARAQFSAYLVGRQKLDEGIRLWNTLNEEQKGQERSTGESVLNTLVAAKHFHQALDLWAVLAPDPASRAGVGQFVDGGFESDPASGGVFGWQVKSVQQAQVSVDVGKHHSGARSLRTVFQVRSKSDVVSISQLIVVAPQTEYDLECYVRTEKLMSAGTPYVEIIDAADGAVLGGTPPLPTGDTDWQRLTMTFRTGAKTEAVTVQVSRSLCGGEPVCPIFGTVWYDDFNLKRRK